MLPPLFADLAELDPRRAEALVHAWPEDAPAAPVSLEILRRWEEVEEAMDSFRELGITATRDDVMAIASRAYRGATGGSLNETIGHYAD
jgi:hypothetical protein